MFDLTEYILIFFVYLQRKSKEYEESRYLCPC